MKQALKSDKELNDKFAQASDEEKRNFAVMRAKERAERADLDKDSPEAHERSVAHGMLLRFPADINIGGLRR